MQKNKFAHYFLLDYGGSFLAFFHLVSGQITFMIVRINEKTGYLRLISIIRIRENA